MAKKQTRKAAIPKSLTRLPVDTPSSIAIDAFKENRKIDGAVKKYLSAPAKKSLDNAKLAETLFKDWSPSHFSRPLRGSGYLGPKESLGEAIAHVLDSGTETLRATTYKRALKVDLGSDLTKVMTPAGEGAPRDVVGTLPIATVIGVLLPILTLPSLTSEPNLTECQARAKADAWLDAVEGKATVKPNPPNVPKAGDVDPQSLTTEQLVDKHVNALMSLQTPPEVLPALRVPPRATQDDATGAVQSFELRSGPSDVTSYHDFHSIQIAFEHVWTELFDERLKGIGATIYREYIEHLDRLDQSVDQRAPITSIDDLKRLVADIRKLSEVAAIPPAEESFGEKLLNWLNIGKQSNEPTPTSSTVQRPPEPAVPGAARLSALLAAIERLLAHDYAFTVFAENSFNFGMMVTYRQTWTPENYQVGDLVSTIPLAPREIRRYTTKRVTKKTRSVKELEDNLRTTKTESSSTSRVEREILSRAEEKTNFHLGAKESFGGKGYEIDATQDAGGDQSKISADTKKHFHEAVLKSAQEYRQQNRMEVSTDTSNESEDTSFHELQNPNDELTVTYLFYELQRTYRIQEKIHQIRPIILVANAVPKPDAIDDAWLIAHDWILRRVILDDSFRPALEYLAKSFVGAELNIQVLSNNATAQKQVVDRITQQVQTQDGILSTDERNLVNAVKEVARLQGSQAERETVKRIFDPIGIVGKPDAGVAAGQTLFDFMQETFDRGEREKARLLDLLGVATTALQAAIDRLSTAIREHYDRVTEIDRLRIHVKQNILYYMQAIWNYEPPDQRYFRSYNIEVSIIEPDANSSVTVTKVVDVDTRLGTKPDHEISITIPQTKVTKKKLVEVADLDTVLGYKGNYAIYPLKENNLVTVHMMQNYIEKSGDALKLRDPDDFANYSVDELKEWAACLYKRDRSTYNTHKEEFKKLIMDRLKSGRPEDDRVVVPTTSLYVEALVGTHPLLEDFKLAHRALDVRKVQAEVRRAELENVRLAARAMEAEYEDPDIDKKIVIEGGTTAVVPVD